MSSLPFRAFAVVPAAGTSQRMGQPKLLLPWRDRTLIEQTLAAWKLCPLAATVVVVRPDDLELAAVCRRTGAEVVVPAVAPPAMRDSVQHALLYLERIHSPRDEDVWLLAPADMPNLSPAIVAHLLAAHRPQQPSILVPTLGGRRGHPVLFPWKLADEVHRLPASDGINVLAQRRGAGEIACDLAANPAAAFEDIDTPQDYRRLKDRAPARGNTLEEL